VHVVPYEHIGMSWKPSSREYFVGQPRCRL
jgi:hypothetical protein